MLSQQTLHPRLIVVEDNFSVANSLEYLLASVGCDVVGVAGNLSSALELVAKVPFDLALLDIDLRGEHVSPVADAVRRQRRPVIFLTGFSDADALPPHLRDLPRLEKPVDPAMLIATIEEVLGTNGGG